MTRHEPSLRAPFDPLPYSALANACERFFEFIIAVRQSAMFYNPGSIRDNPVAAQKLLRHRRDAVAAILGNLYILGGALRSQRKVPVSLPFTYKEVSSLLTFPPALFAKCRCRAEEAARQDCGGRGGNCPACREE